MISNESADFKMNNRSHRKDPVASSFEDTLRKLKSNVMMKGNLPHVSVERQLEVIDDLATFPFGRYIIERRGANGYWTDYLIAHPQNGRLSGLNSEGDAFGPMEDFLLNRAPVVVAHQERFQIFQEISQTFVKEGVVMASIPCGIMRDLLTLDFSHVTDYKLVGVDLDHDSLSHARKLAQEQGIDSVDLLQMDAWKLSFRSEFDVINSNGLNVYESDREKVVDLYHNLYRALRPGGALVSGILTYPPSAGDKSDWLMEGMREEDILMDQVLHKDILDINWSNFRTLEDAFTDFQKAGFRECSLRCDKHRVFPTVIAYK